MSEASPPPETGADGLAIPLLRELGAAQAEGREDVRSDT